VAAVRILVVDDDDPIREVLTIALEMDGSHAVRTAATGRQALDAAREWPPDAVVLDVSLPDLDGFAVCRELRAFSAAPVLFLTARDSDVDKLRAFGAGADDYVTKPFNPLEVVARLRAHLRRHLTGAARGGDRAEVYDLGRARLDATAGTLEVDGRPMACPAREFQLLAFLCRHPGRVFSRGQLYEQVWGAQSLGDDNTVMVHIRRLRERVEADPADPRLLVTVRGLGYKLILPPGPGTP